MSLGVDYSVFWTLTPKKLQPFVKAKEEEIKLHMTMINNEAWLTGLYVRSAIASVFSKGTKYPKQPSASDDRNGQNNSEEVFKKQFEAFSHSFNKGLKK